MTQKKSSTLASRENMHIRTSLRHTPRSATIGRGVAIGFLVWIAYAIVEYLFCSVATAASYYPSAMFSPWHWRLTSELMLAYAVVGAGVGAICGVMLSGRAASEGDTGRLLRSATTLALIMAFLLNAAAQASSLGASDWGTCITTLTLAVGLGLNLSSKSWFERIGRYIHPWLVIWVITVGPWMTQTWLRLAAWVAAALISLIWGRRKAGAPWGLSVARQAVGSLVLAAGAAIATAGLHHGLPPTAIQSRQPAGNGAPNIVLITMDTVRADHLPLYGYGRNTAPNLSEFAAHATAYRYAVAASNMTLSSHASMFTGLYASAHGAHFDPPLYELGRPLASGIPTLSAMLAEHGYVTAGVVANFAYLGPYYGLDRGFQIYDVRQPMSVRGRDSGVRLFLRNGIRQALGLFGWFGEFDRVTRRADEIDDAAFGLLRKIAPGKRPFFLFVNYMDAHWPYLPPPPFDSRFPGKLKNFSDASYRRLATDLMGLKRQITPPEREHLTSQYDGAIAYLDSQIDRLLGRLKELGLYDGALIIVTSDHGENFGDRNLLQHGMALYHDEVNIPLIVKYPGQKQGQTTNDLVSQIDIPPTILETARIPRPSAFAGQSLRQAIEADRYLFSEAFPPEDTPPGSLAPQSRRTQRAAYHRFQKLIQSSPSGGLELYDLRTDPEERSDAYREKSQLAASMDAALKEWEDQQPKFTRGQATPAQVVNQLKSLGYVQ
jgi:arylsulfatase A-like enzyme